MQATEQSTLLGYGGALTLMAKNPQSMPSPSRQPSTRACALCVKAKAKCTPHPDIEGVCQRRVAQLEQKLDGLVTLLTSNQSTLAMAPLSQASGVLSPTSPVSLNSNASTAEPSTATPQSISSDRETTDLTFAPAAENVSVTSQEVPQLKPDGQEAEILLLEFKTNMTEQFPFVVIDSDSTSQSLHNERPLLWKAIMGAASHGNSDRQMALGANLLEDLTTRLLLKAEKSLDLLQALLVFIACFPYDESYASRKPDAPIEMFVRAWQKELEIFWSSLPAEYRQNRLLLATYHTIEIALYEVDMSDCPMCLPRVPVKVVDRTGRLEFIYTSLLATRKVFDVYSSVPVDRMSGICFTLWAQFNHALLNGVKLIKSEADGWDLQHARNVLTFPDILHSQVKAIEEVISRRGLVLETAMDGKDVFTRFLFKLNNVLRWYESSRFSRIEPQTLSDQPTDPNGFLEATDGESLPAFDDAFWQNLLDDNWMLVGDGFST
ncbi:MAG: hypothetical protein ASARMPRED_004732 [Alectoria sarmentosa]|nr:MAG: hypothetical protein ASARMPRED_004732 [Alectoria sarmentosa]